MVCLDTHSCILISYHPETKTANYFLCHCDNMLMDIIIDVCNAILEKTCLINCGNVKPIL